MPMVAGIMAMDWAKMMGSTPLRLTLMGMWVDWATIHLPAHHALGVLNRHTTLRLVMNTIKMMSSSIPTTRSTAMRGS